MAEEEQAGADMQEDEAYVEYEEPGLEGEGAGEEDGGEPMDVSCALRLRARAFACTWGARVPAWLFGRLFSLAHEPCALPHCMRA